LHHRPLAEPSVRPPASRRTERETLASLGSHQAKVLPEKHQKRVLRNVIREF
jgi:hypothetical protein